MPDPGPQGRPGWSETLLNRDLLNRDLLNRDLLNRDLLNRDLGPLVKVQERRTWRS